MTVSPAIMPELYIARTLARALAVMNGCEIDPAQIEHEDDLFDAYVCDQERLERSYVGPNQRSDDR